MLPAGPMDVWNMRLKGKGSESTLPVEGAARAEQTSGKAQHSTTQHSTAYELPVTHAQKTHLSAE